MYLTCKTCLDALNRFVTEAFSENDLIAFKFDFSWFFYLTNLMSDS